MQTTFRFWRERVSKKGVTSEVLAASVPLRLLTNNDQRKWCNFRRKCSWMICEEEFISGYITARLRSLLHRAICVSSLA